MKLLRLAVLSLVLAAIVPAAASASFPGKNGDLVLSIENCNHERYLATMPWTGGELVPLTERCTQEQANDEEIRIPTYPSPDAAPDGHSILAQRCVTGNPPCRFVTVDPNDGGVSELPVPDEVYAYGVAGPSYAPDGNRFVWHGDRYQYGHDAEPIWEIGLDGATRKIREAPGCGRRENCARFNAPRWSPDGKLIAVEVSSYNRYRRKPQVMAGGIWLIRAKDGKPVRRLTKHGGNVDWAPSGKFIVYRTDWYRDEGGGASGGNLHIVSRDGKTKRKLVHRHGIAETDPAWSPDGRWIAWVSVNPTGGDVSFRVNPSLWRVRATGGKPQRIRRLPQPSVEEGEYVLPQITWLRAASSKP